ncbi:MAG: cbb3-type cytochrome oxidase assembly protein CcoS [Pikeienuella sp.]
MTIILPLMALSLVAGLTALLVFLWSLKSGQYDDLEGAGQRVLNDDAEDGTGK